MICDSFYFFLWHYEQSEDGAWVSGWSGSEFFKTWSCYVKGKTFPVWWRWECVCMVRTSTHMYKYVYTWTCLLPCCWGGECSRAIGFWVFFPDKLSMWKNNLCFVFLLVQPGSVDKLQRNALVGFNHVFLLPHPFSLTAGSQCTGVSHRHTERAVPFCTAGPVLSFYDLVSTVAAQPKWPF